MTLEDFFTLTELKNGLATVSRVEELISVMQQQKNCATNNLSDTARQWSTVAVMLAATENKDCLTHFVKSNGLSYLNQWLQEALKCSNDAADFAAEELLKALLGSLERLPITEEDSVASGIQFVVEQLIGSKSIDIKEKARTLSERWKHAIEKDASYHHMNKDEKCKDDNLKHPGDVCVVDGANSVPPQAVDISTYKEEPEASNNREKSAGCMDIPQSDVPSDLSTSTANKSIPANAKSDDTDALPSTLVPNSCREDLSGACCSNAPEDVADDHRDVSARKDDIVLDMKMDVDKNEGHPSDQKESSEIPPDSDLLSVSSLAHKPGRSASCNFDAKEIKPHKSDIIGTLSRSASIDCVVPAYLRNVDLKPDMQDILSNGSKLRIKDDLGTSLDKKEEIGSTAKVEGSEGRLETVASLNSLKAIDKKSIVGMDQSSELGLEYGEIDALEVARQVAIEVEREVVDYREPFCSSSPDCSSSEEMGRQCSEGPKDRTAYAEQNGKDHDDASSLKDGNKLISESGADKGADKCVQEVEMSMDGKIFNLSTHESSEKTNQNRCIFDLNEDVYPDESSDCLISSALHNAINVSAPIAVAASKGASFLPVSPLRFEGELGWKGSAATSAFRPASPRRTPDVEKTSSGHKRKASLIEFDLNVVDSGVDPVHPGSVKSIHQDDSAEVSSGRADRFKLDLNRVEDEDMPPIPSSLGSLPRLNGNQTMSPASSSSSRQAALRNFDLNDNPSFFDATHNYKKISSKTGNPGITIMGSNITERKDYPSGTPQSLMGNGPTIMPYGHFPIHAYGYNGHTMGPSMSFPSPLYGHGNIPYMVDSRGATVAPQILTTAGLSTASSAIPPFLMRATDTSLGLNGVGTSQSGLDVNSMGNGNFKNFLQGRHGLTEDPVRAASQPGGSMNGKEADSGWEPYNFMAQWR